MIHRVEIGSRWQAARGMRSPPSIGVHEARRASAAGLPWLDDCFRLVFQ